MFTAMNRWRGAVGRGLLVAAVAFLAGSTVFVDEIVHGRRIDDEIVLDGIVGLLLAATAMLAALTVIRLLDARRRADRRRRVAEAALAARDSGHAASVLRELARRAREVTASDRAAVAMRERDDPAWSRIEAVDGGPSEMVGNRVGTDQGAAGEVFASAQPVAEVDWQRLGYDSAGACLGASLPIAWSGEVHGVLSVARAAGAASLRADEVTALAGLVDLSALALEQAEVRGRLERAAQAGVEALAAAVDMRDNYTAEHSEQVVGLARRVARQLGVSGSALSEVEVAARLHDVGKIGVPDAILNKRGPLDADEWQIVRQHPEWGSQMLARVPELAGIAVLIRYEHERWDGKGYPDGLAGEEIPLASRIVFVCDAYHAITSTRPYREARSSDEALRELEANAGSQFDPEAVRALSRVVAA
jgi:HD domain